MAWFEHGGSRIYYEEEGSGDPLLLIPGLTLSIEDMKPVREALTPRYRVIAADSPGSGKSEPQPRRYPVTYYQDDARSFLALIEKLGATPAHVVGFSDGGEYALLMAEMDPAVVSSIVVWGAIGVVPAGPAAEMFGNVIDNPIPPMQEFSNFLKGAYGEENARIMTQTASQAWMQMTEAGGDISLKSAGAIQCPALLITGEHDFMATPSAVSALAQAIPNAEFIEAKGASHAVHHDNTEWLIKTVTDWLGKR